MTVLTKVALAILYILIFFGLFPTVINLEALAQPSISSFFTVVNPVRVSFYTKDSAQSIKAQYFQVNSRNLPATWLLSYDVLNNKTSIEEIKKFDDKQELGLLFEINSNFANSSGVIYNQSDSWHRSNSIFLNGYSQEDRKKLIDTLFENFNNKFGYYPKSVGGWWIDAYSLNYMSNKYGVIANLNVADQAGTDGYHVWGTYWSTPYYPNKINALYPAKNTANKLDVVTLRWASRDPLNGYISPDDRETTRFSTQDYLTINLGHDYFENLLRLYVKQDFGQITIGLEGDFNPEVYQENYSTHLSIAQKLSQTEGVRFTTMKEFADEYRKKYPDISPNVLIEGNDILGSSKRIYWFQNANYRVGIIHDFSNNSTEIVDLRSYYKDFPEPFYVGPNKQPDLFSVAPAIVDSKTKTNKTIKLSTGLLVRSEENAILFEKGFINFKDKEIVIEGIDYKVDQDLMDTRLIQSSGNGLIISDNYLFTSNGYVFSELMPKIPYAVRYRIPQILVKFILFGITMVLILLIIMLSKKSKKYSVGFILISFFILLFYIVARNSYPLYVSQSEIDALSVLSRLDFGKVLLYDKDCLKCKWSTKNKPAAMEGRKNYVKELSGKPIVYSLDFVLAKTPDEGKEVLKKLGVKYIYLAKYEDYIEALSFNPQDLNLKKVYENANGVIYEIKMPGRL